MLSEIGTVASENANCLDDFSDARTCVELNIFVMKLEKIEKA